MVEFLVTATESNVIESLIATATPGNAALMVGLIAARQLVEMVGKQIPDTATGWQAGLRRVCKTLALYVPNKE